MFRKTSTQFFETFGKSASIFKGLRVSFNINTVSFKIVMGSFKIDFTRKEKDGFTKMGRESGRKEEGSFGIVTPLILFFILIIYIISSNL